MNKIITGVPDWNSNEARDNAVAARSNFKQSIKELQNTKLAYFELKEQWAVDRQKKIEE